MDVRDIGVEVLKRLKETHPDIEVIMFTGLAEIATAVNCMKLGTFDYLAKPFEPEELALAVTRALEHRSLRQENLNLKLALSSRYRLDNMIGAGPRMQQVYRLIAPSLERLGKTYPSWEEFLATMRAAPSFHEWWDPAIEAYERRIA